MNLRKRSASETLFPTRSTKHPRTTRERYAGGENPSASQREGLGARWTRLWTEACKLAGESLVHLAEGIIALLMPFSYCEFNTMPWIVFKHTEKAPLPLQSPSTPSPTSNTHLPFRTPIPLQFTRPIDPPPRSNGSIQESTVTVPMVVDAPSLPSTVTVTASTTTVPSSSNFSAFYPEISPALVKSQQRIRRISSRRRYQSRKHIFADMVRILYCYVLSISHTSTQHKAKVKAEMKRDREQMEKDLYNLRRNTGTCMIDVV
jgi:hypothetical protein